MTAPRSTSSRTAAATAARQRKKAQNGAVELVLRMKHLDDDWLAEIVRVLNRELRDRSRMTNTLDVTLSDVTDSQPSINTTTESE